MSTTSRSPRRTALRGVAVLLGLLPLLGGSAEAQKVRGATSGVVDIGGTYSSAFDLLYAYNQSGLLVGYTSGVTGWDTFFTGGGPKHDWSSSGQEWFSLVGVSSATVTFNLGAAYSVSGLALWNEDANGIGTFNLLYSTDGTNFLPLLSSQVPTDNPVDPYQDYSADIFNWAATSMQYVRLEMSGCPVFVPGADPYQNCSIGEVAFRDAGGLPGSAVPEPATVGLLATGLLGMAGAGYLRRRTQPVA